MSTTTYTVTELSLDHVGILATDGAIVYYLTSCCRASATGTTAGTACRACYRLVDVELGNGWMVDDAAAWARWRSAFLADAYAKNEANRTSGVPERLADLVVDRAKSAGAK